MARKKTTKTTKTKPPKPPKGTPTNTNLFALSSVFGYRNEVPNGLSATDKPHLRRCLAAGLVEVDGKVLRLTPKGVKALGEWRDRQPATLLPSTEIAGAANAGEPPTPAIRRELEQQPAYTLQLTAGPRVSVSSLSSASNRVRAHVEKYDLGGSEWFAQAGSEAGNIYDSQGKVIARISYNGRAWQPAPLGERSPEIPIGTPLDAIGAKVVEAKETVSEIRRRAAMSISPEARKARARKAGLARAKKAGHKGMSEAGRKGLLAAAGVAAATCPPTEPGYRGSIYAYVLTPRGKEPCFYGLRPLESLITSHNPETWQADPRYPALVQERDYSGDPNEQLKVGRISKGLDVAVLLNNSPTAVDGPPVVSSGGYVLGGNGRTMGLRLAYDTGLADAYRAELAERAPIFGLTPEQVREVPRPVLVRVVPSLDGASQQQLADASSRLNEGLTGSLDERAKGVADARRLSQNTIRVLAELLDEHETLRKAMAEAGPRIVASLRADGIVTPQNSAAMVSGEGGLTEAGKTRLEGAFLGLVAGTPERLANASASTIQRLERLVPYLVQVRAVHPEADAIPHFTAALDLLHQADAAGMPLDRFLEQGDLFGGGLTLNKEPAQSVSTASSTPAERGDRMDFLIVTTGSRGVENRVFEGLTDAEFAHQMGALGFKQTGSKGGSVRAELQGRPMFRGLNGPMWNDGQIRYEGDAGAQIPPVGIGLGAGYRSASEPASVAVPKGMRVEGDKLHVEGLPYALPIDHGDVARAVKDAEMLLEPDDGSERRQMEIEASEPNRFPRAALDAADALAHLRSGGRAEVRTSLRVYPIDAKTLAKFEKGKHRLLWDDGEGIRMADGKKSVYLLPGQLTLLSRSH